MDIILILSIAGNIIMLIALIPNCICAYQACKTDKARKRGKPKGIRHKKKPAQPITDCSIYIINGIDDIKLVNIKTTAHACRLAVVFINC